MMEANQPWFAICWFDHIFFTFSITFPAIFDSRYFEGFRSKCLNLICTHSGKLCKLITYFTPFHRRLPSCRTIFSLPARVRKIFFPNLERPQLTFLKEILLKRHFTQEKSFWARNWCWGQYFRSIIRGVVVNVNLNRLTTCGGLTNDRSDVKLAAYRARQATTELPQETIHLCQD